MKILQVVDIAYEAGGAEKSVRLIRDALRERGHDVRVLATDKHARGQETFADVMVPVIGGSVPGRLFRHFWYVRGYRQVRALLRDFQPDVVHLHTISEFSPSLLWALGRTPAVMTVHGPEEFTGALLPWLLPASDYRRQSYEWRDIRAVGRLRYLYYRCLQRPAYRLMLKRVKLVIAPSQFMADQLLDDFPRGRIAQIYNGITLLPATPLPPKGYILYVGRLEVVKGVDHLLCAFAEVHRRLPQARLRIIGDGDQRAELKRLAKSLRVGASVELPGWVAPEHISREFNGSQLVAVPSVWPENLPTVAIEALAVGRPIVGSRTGGIIELVSDGHNGRLVEPGDEAALAEALIGLLSDRRRLERAGAASEKRSHQFDVARFINQLLTVYKEVAK